MKKFNFCILILLLTAACMPTRSFIDLDLADNTSFFNNHIDGKSHTLRFVEGENVNPKRVFFAEDSVYYSIRKTEYVAPISNVKSLTTTNKPSISKLISVPLIILGVLSFATIDYEGSVGAGLGKLVYGGYSVVIGSAVLVAGTQSESKTYYFSPRE